MKQKFPFLLLLIASCLVFFSGCKKDVDVNGNTPITPTDTTNPITVRGYPIPAPSPLSGSITGMVINENGVPVTGAQVVFGSATYQTDAKGYFNINNVTLDKYITTVTVNVPGYFKAIRSFSATASRNYVSIKLVPKTLVGSVDAVAGGILSLANGTKMSFAANSFVLKSSGAAYTGSVKIYASYIDPVAADFNLSIPGNTTGTDGAYLYRANPAAILAIEPESVTGEALQLVQGKPAAVELPIPASLLNKVPSIINTWSLNDNGIWKKEGSATRVNGHYEMQLTHCSYWNCAAPVAVIHVTNIIHDAAGHPVSNIDIAMGRQANVWGSSYGMTDSAGTVTGFIPLNVNTYASLSVSGGTCSAVLYTQQLNQVHADSTINITATLEDGYSSVLSGTVTDCNGQPLDTGAVTIYAGDFRQYTTAVSNGTYNLVAPHCQGISPITVAATNNAGAQGNTGNFTGSGSNISLPNVAVCNGVVSAAYTVAGCQTSGTYTAGTPLAATNVVMFIVDVQVVGDYTLSGSANGMSFNATGTFTHTGADTVYITGTGTPTTAGTTTINISGGTGGSCAPVFTVAAAPVSVATYTFLCGTLVVNGTFTVNQNSPGTIVFDVNVTSPGTYYIHAIENANGSTFAGKTGTFQTTGTQTVSIPFSIFPSSFFDWICFLQSDSVDPGPFPTCTFDIQIH